MTFILTVSNLFSKKSINEMNINCIILFLQVKRWIKAAFQNRSLETSCLLMITLDCLVTMVADTTTKMAYSILLADLSENFTRQKV